MGFSYFRARVHVFDKSGSNPKRFRKRSARTRRVEEIDDNAVEGTREHSASS